MSNEEKECCCHDYEEHEHHHEHDEACHCHDHEHEHHHEHDEACHCHDHEHEHHHEHDECGCGHDHDHDHHDHEHIDGISIVYHEEALAGSFSVESSKSIKELDAIIKDGMNLLRTYIEFKEGVIGHIKAAVTSGDDAVMYSLTYDEVYTTGSLDCINAVDKVNFAAIVYGASDEALLALLKEIKHKIS